MNHLEDLETIEAEMLKSFSLQKRISKSYKKNLWNIITQFGDFRDSQLQIEEVVREAECKSEKEMLSDTGSDQGRGFETADKYNLRLNTAAGQTTDGPDETVVYPEWVQRKDARVHFDTEQVKRLGTVPTGRQESQETSSQSESDESASEEDKIESLRQQLAIKNYQEKKEQLASKDRELAEVELQNRQLISKLDKEKTEKFKYSNELQKQTALAASANHSSNTRNQPLHNPGKDSGAAPKYPPPDSRDLLLDNIEQSRADRQCRKSGF
jgi:hypothetical protein